MKQNYITAVLNELKTDNQVEKVLEGLQRTLKSRGHTSLYASILRGVVRVLEAGSADDSKVVVVSEAQYEANKQKIEAALAKLESKAAPSLVFDKTIIGGYVVEANNKRIDASYKSKLVTLYRSLTK